MKKAVFIDKDGTLIPDIPYNVNPDLINLERYSVEGLRLLHARDYLVIIITNQSGVAMGYFEEGALKGVHDKISDLLLNNGIPLSGFYHCPHHIQGVIKEFAVDCNCRKPQPGLLITAAKDLEINLAESWMIGDILNDIEAGKTAGCRTVLINNGNETEWLINERRVPDHIAGNIRQAAEYILNATRE